MCGRNPVASALNVAVPPLAVTSTCSETGLRFGLQRTTLRLPAGTPEIWNEPSAATRVQWPLGTTSTSERIFEWMLQKISTGPALSSTTGAEVSPPLTDPRSNEFPADCEKTLWMTVSWLGKMTRVP